MTRGTLAYQSNVKFSYCPFSKINLSSPPPFSASPKEIPILLLFFFLTSLGSPDTDESIAWFRVDFKCYRLKPRFLFFSHSTSCQQKSQTHIYTQISFSTVNMTRASFLPSPQHLPCGISPSVIPRAEYVRTSCVPAASLNTLHSDFPFPLQLLHKNVIHVSAEAQTALPPGPRTAGNTGTCSVNAY